METTVKTILSVRSSAFEHEQFIPEKYSCEGAGVNPPLQISGIPEEARSIAIIMEDPTLPPGYLIIGWCGIFRLLTQFLKTQFRDWKEKTAVVKQAISVLALRRERIVISSKSLQLIVF